MEIKSWNQFYPIFWVKTESEIDFFCLVNLILNILNRDISITYYLQAAILLSFAYISGIYLHFVC